MECLLLNSCLVGIIWKFLEQIWLPLTEGALYVRHFIYIATNPHNDNLEILFFFVDEGTEAQRGNCWAMNRY